jgi:hypothetical protein
MTLKRLGLLAAVAVALVGLVLLVLFAVAKALSGEAGIL